MTNILLIGASSFLGKAITKQFAKDNQLLLLGRQKYQLEVLADIARRHHQAQSAQVLSCDLAHDIESVKTKLVDFSPDLIIWISSATSRLRDKEIKVTDVKAHTAVDLLSPLALIEHGLQHTKKPLRVIFVSTILTLVKSPDREIYSNYKSLAESWLKQFKAQYAQLELFTARICTFLPYDRETYKAQQIAKKIFVDYQKHPEKRYGFLGKCLLLTQMFHPHLAKIILVLQRKLRDFMGKSDNQYN